MVTVTKTRRRSAVLTSSSLACLSVLPTINLTAGCLHDCTYCYIRGYRNYPGESKIVLYEDTLERLQNEMQRASTKPHAVYFSPSSDLFQPAQEVLDLSHAILEFLFSEGVGVAFLTKGRIPEKTLELLAENAALVRAQIGLISIDERISSVFEPHAAAPDVRLAQLERLIAGGVAAEARLDPILPALTDDPASLDEHFAALAGAGVTRAAAGVLFLRPPLVWWLKRSVPEDVLKLVLEAFAGGDQARMRGSPWPIQNLSAEVCQQIFARLRVAAEAHGIQLKVCACKNGDIAQGSCNIAGTWPSRSRKMRQPALAMR